MALRRRDALAGALALAAAGAILGASRQAGGPSGGRHLPWEGGSEYYRRWSHGPPADPSFFPISVWYPSAGDLPGASVPLAIPAAAGRRARRLD